MSQQQRLDVRSWNQPSPSQMDFSEHLVAPELVDRPKADPELTSGVFSADE